jgi:hypothetical protein
LGGGEPQSQLATDATMQIFPSIADRQVGDVIRGLDRPPDADGGTTEYYPSRFKGFCSTSDKEFYFMDGKRPIFAMKSLAHKRAADSVGSRYDPEYAGRVSMT